MDNTYLDMYEKQPADVQDYQADFTPWLDGLVDTAAAYTVEAQPGITLQSHSRTDGVVTFWLSGGVHGNNYKITVRLTSANARVREEEILIIVKER